MGNVIAWIEAHPVLFGIFWTTLTGFVTGLFKARTPEQYAAMNPRVAAALKLVGGLGFDVPNTMEAIRQIMTGHAVPAGVYRSARVQAVAAAKEPPDDPPPPPVVGPAVLACLMLALTQGACGGEDKRVQAAAQQPAFIAEQRECALTAKATDAGLAGSRACRCEVQRRWGCPEGCASCERVNP
jgi:hypothetical protein